MCCCLGAGLGSFSSNCGPYLYPVSCLKAGDEIVISKGEKYAIMNKDSIVMKEAEEDFTDIVWKVDESSAITAREGIIINCHFAGFEKTGKFYNDFNVSEKAKKICSDIERRIQKFIKKEKKNI